MSEVILTLLFVFTAAVVYIDIQVTIAQWCGNGYVPSAIIPFTGLHPTNGIILYPSVMYQIYFWFNLTDII
jgi:hypothetical protein